MTKKITKLMLNGEEYEIREYQAGWQPGANTLAYLKLEDNTTDTSGNSNSGTATDLTYTTLSNGKKVATFNGTSSKIDFSSSILSNGSTAGTFSIWTYGTFNFAYDLRVIFCPAQNDSDGFWTDVFADTNYKAYRACMNNSLAEMFNEYAPSTWNLITVTIDNGTISLYKNGQLLNSRGGASYANNTNFAIGYRKFASDRFRKGYLSDFICEDIAWTAQEISDYYDLTKGDYGIS